jgi:hypothetical protein
MTSSAKTLGTAVFAGLAIPVGGVSGIGAVGSLLALIFSSSSCTSGTFLSFLAAVSVFGAAFYFLASLQKQGTQLVLVINQRESLSLDAVHLLCFPRPAFVIIDRRQRRITVCNSSTQVLEMLA